METDKVVAYIGKHILHDNADYVLIPERSHAGCNGCDLVGKCKCTKDVVKYCTQGYILKKYESNIK